MTRDAEELAGRSRLRQHPLGQPKSKMPSKKFLLLLFAWPVLIGCIFNVWLHSNATSRRDHRRGEAINDPSDDDFAYGGKAATSGVRNGAGGSRKPPTYAPTTATSYAPTAPNRSWAPTNRLTTMRPTATRIGRADKIDFQYDDERPLAHPRVACFGTDDGAGSNHRESKKGTSCTSLDVKKRIRVSVMPSIPLEAKQFKGGNKGDAEEEDENDYRETDTCKYSQHPSCSATSIAPSTCNDIHALGFDHRIIHEYKSLHTKVEYITMGGAKCIWKVTAWNGVDGGESFIFKSHKNSRFLKRHFWSANHRDALISGGVGNMQLSRVGESSTDMTHWNHVLPMYQFCGLSNIVPLAEGTLVEYINSHQEEIKTRANPADTLNLALQAARGLYQAQLYWQGKPTFVHADLNPSQFLVFKSNSDSALPILQINDFNQGRFLTRSVDTGDVCPFRSCTKNQRGNRYHTPERFMGCVDQNDLIDSYSLGGVFFFLLSGLDPFYDVRSYNKPIKAGELPNFPSGLDLDHPAHAAVKDVMIKCMAYELNDRPSSLEVVQMLEEAERNLVQVKGRRRKQS